MLKRMINGLVLGRAVRLSPLVLSLILLSGCIPYWEKTEIEEDLLYCLVLSNKLEDEIMAKFECEQPWIDIVVVYLPGIERELSPYWVKLYPRFMYQFMYLRAGSQGGGDFDRAFILIRIRCMCKELCKCEDVSIIWELHYDNLLETWQRVKVHDEPREIRWREWQ